MIGGRFSIKMPSGKSYFVALTITDAFSNFIHDGSSVILGDKKNWRCHRNRKRHMYRFLLEKQNSFNIKFKFKEHLSGVRLLQNI